MKLHANIQFRDGDQPGAHYVSGNLVFDEFFVNGRLLTRYWNPNGQIWSELNLSSIKWDKDQPADTFQLSINQCDLSGGYTWVSNSIESEGEVKIGVIHLRHTRTNVDVKVYTRVDGSPFIIRWLEITNVNQEAVGISAVSPMSGALWTHRYEEHLPSQYTSPFELAYNHSFEWGREGDFWFEPLPDGSKSINGEKKGRSGWGRPAFWARNLCNGQTFVCELAWGGNYEFSLDCRLHGGNWGWIQVKPLSKQAELYFRMGLSGYDEALRVLDPGESVITPAVHIGLFQENTDVIVQATHDHVRNVVMPKQIPGREVEIESNHRGYLCDRENVPDIIKDIDVAASVGAEMYVIDAGWYGHEPNQWGNNTGDWTEGPWMENGGGLMAVVDHAHKKGMKFGLWVEIEAAGANSYLKKDHPEWLLKRDGVPIANGRALDLTNLEVAAFEKQTIERLIRTYHLDMFRIDHNHLLQPAGNREYKGFKEDLTWRYYSTLYTMFDNLRHQFPNVVFQDCAGGGGRLDWGTLGHFHNAELSDWMRMPRGLKILNGVTMSLPPEFLLRTFGTEVGEQVLEGNVETQLRLCMSRIIFRGIAPSLEEVTPYLREKIEHYLSLYKKYIRPIMLDGVVFHHTPFTRITEIDPWCTLEYAYRNRSASVVGIFKTSPDPKNSGDIYTLIPRGIDPGRDYRVTLDNKQETFIISGRELALRGLPINLETNLSSELILFEAC